MKDYKNILMEELGVEELQEMVTSANNYNGALDFLEYYENDENFFEEMFQSKDEVARAICYGEYNYMDDYVTFNAYGNLESCNKWELEKEIEEYKEEIIDNWLIIYEEDPTYVKYDEATKIIENEGASENE